MGETLRNSGRCKKSSQEIGEKVRDNHSETLGDLKTEFTGNW